MISPRLYHIIEPNPHMTVTPPPPYITVTPPPPTSPLPHTPPQVPPKSNCRLPQPADLGAGNPFLICSCVSLLLQHEHLLMSQPPADYHELAMLLDGRRATVPAHQVLTRARQIYAEYIHAQSAQDAEITRLGT